MNRTEKKFLADRRKAAGLSIYKLAKLAGVQWRTVRDVECGYRAPMKLTLERIEAVLSQYEHPGGSPDAN